MSSAATVQGSHQQHNYSQSVHARDPYYNLSSQATGTASPPASNRASRRPSGNGKPSSPQHSQSKQSPPTPNASRMNTPRTQALHSSEQNSPLLSTNASSNQNSPNGLPFALPPRTSSQNQNHAVTAPASDVQLPVRTVDDRQASSRRKEDTPKSQKERVRDNAPYTPNASSAQSRKSSQTSSREPQHQRSSGSGKPKKQAGHSRSATAIGSPPHGTSLGHEGSKVINRVVIADPQEDIARERARQAEAEPVTLSSTDRSPVTGSGNGDVVVDAAKENGRNKQDGGSTSSRKKDVMFGDYHLGQTLGEGEFGKVRMGWKKEGGVQVAVKLIRRESLGSNPSRLPKIHREIAILRKLQHPNIVRLHEMVETERHIGIILEYASGGELFDYILKYRFLKDNAARRLFAQLISGVGYLHKKGIVHRDLKLENLLLDRNRNIIITDFGFANTFDPIDELSDEIEYNLNNKDFVERANLAAQNRDGHRRGDLMQTSCGSPCYAAPELVVSDSLYTGRKVDVWSCGVILYAMLAGYLPFDDDPANPEGDNINLLYKYIVSTPLTFPEWVTPGAKDLLKRILVPDPRKRADLFEVARHSWLSEYAHVVGFITSSTTSPSDIANITVPSDDPFEAPHLTRSASVREPSKSQGLPAVGGLTPKQNGLDQAENLEKKKSQRDAKRRTVQVEYVAPQSQTVRGEASPVASPVASLVATAAAAQVTKTRVRNEKQGPVEVVSEQPYIAPSYAQPVEEPVQPIAQPIAQQSTMPPPSKPVKDPYLRGVSDMSFGNPPMSLKTDARPSTGGSMGARLPSRGNSYSQPVGPTVAATTASGHFSQPARGTKYNISGPVLQSDSLTGDSIRTKPLPQRPGSVHIDSATVAQSGQKRGHKRSSTLGNVGEKLFGRRGSVFGGKAVQEPTQAKQKQYPPVSMQNNAAVAPVDAARRSSESRRTSFGFSRKLAEAQPGDRRSHRLSTLLPAWTSRTSSATKDGTSRSGAQLAYPEKVETVDQAQVAIANATRNRSQQRPVMAFGRGDSTPSLSTTSSTAPAVQETRPERFREGRNGRSAGSQMSTRQPTSQPASYPTDKYGVTTTATYDPPTSDARQQSHQAASRPSVGRAPSSFIAQALDAHHQQQQQQQQTSSSAFGAYDSNPRRSESAGQRGQVYSKFDRQTGLQPNRKFTDAYEAETGHGHHAGSSGAARRVMDFFRKRAKVRGGE